MYAFLPQIARAGLRPSFTEMLARFAQLFLGSVSGAKGQRLLAARAHGRAGPRACEGDDNRRSRQLSAGEAAGIPRGPKGL